MRTRRAVDCGIALTLVSSFSAFRQLPPQPASARERRAIFESRAVAVDSFVGYLQDVLLPVAVGEDFKAGIHELVGSVVVMTQLEAEVADDQLAARLETQTGEISQLVTSAAALATVVCRAAGVVLGPPALPAADL